MGSSNQDRRVELPAEAPADFISCNTCLIRKWYIHILPCNPREVGWPHRWRRCSKCEYGLDCETWVRVKSVGERVSDAIGVYHPVTWADIGLVPFQNGDLFFPDKLSLDYFISSLSERYPGHFGLGSANSCECSPAPSPADVLEVSEPDQERLECTLSHCIGFFRDFGFYPASCERHTI